MSATAAAVVPAPGFGQPQPGQQRSTARPEQVRGRTRPPEGQQRGMDPVLERDPVTDKMQPPPSSLPLRPHRRGRQPDRRDQIAAGKLSQHPRVDPVGLAGQWGQALDRLPVGDPDLPPGQLQLVMHEPRAIHRLDRRDHRLAEQRQLPR
jgi:hypothetical protein